MLEQSTYCGSAFQNGRLFSEKLASLSPFFDNKTVLQIGRIPENLFLNCQPTEAFMVMPFAALTAHVVSHFLHLPIQRESIDTILLPLTLEYFKNTSDFLNEVDRILKPYGFLVILGIHPMSLFGLQLKCRVSHLLKKEGCYLRSPLFLTEMVRNYGYQKHTLFRFNQHRSSSWRIKAAHCFAKDFYCLALQKHEEASLFLRTEDIFSHFSLGSVGNCITTATTHHLFPR